jgi:hypothetical protein
MKIDSLRLLWTHAVAIRIIFIERLLQRGFDQFHTIQLITQRYPAKIPSATSFYFKSKTYQLG